MPPSLRSHLLTPSLVHEDVRRRILTVLLLIAFAGNLLVVISELGRDPRSPMIPVFAVFLAVLGLCFLLIYRGWIELPSWLLTLGLLAMVSYSAYTQNGVHDITTVFFPVIIVFSSVLLSRWGAILVALLASVFLAFLVHQETTGAIVNAFSDKTDYFDIIPLLTAIWAIQAFQWVLMNNFWRDLVSARELSQDLESRVAERTAQLEATNLEMIRVNASLAATNAQLESANTRLEQANRELEAFSYSVSHDLRAPLRAINGFSMALVEDFHAELKPEARGYLESIRRNTLRMSDLIDGMLRFSRTSRLPLECREVDMTDLVRQVVAQLREEYPDREVELTLDDLPSCSGDHVLLRQVWYNLLSNAYKFTRQAQHARVTVGAQETTEGKVYFVRDNGVGFDMQYAGRLFGVFQRLHRAEDFEGTGVGLAITQRILQRHKGRIWADAHLGEGATFYFTL